ncbi:MAG TPA: hypothetical protein VEW95_06480 [Candidatus Limnocylindrales bacterium]|nr:hypothetical protein [Candidatus Limnocylindrales bacterium]
MRRDDWFVFAVGVYALAAGVALSGADCPRITVEPCTPVFPIEALAGMVIATTAAIVLARRIIARHWRSGSSRDA